MFVYPSQMGTKHRLPVLRPATVAPPTGLSGCPPDSASANTPLEKTRFTLPHSQTRRATAVNVSESASESASDGNTLPLCPKFHPPPPPTGSHFPLPFHRRADRRLPVRMGKTANVALSPSRKAPSLASRLNGRSVRVCRCASGGLASQRRELTGHALYRHVLEPEHENLRQREGRWHAVGNARGGEVGGWSLVSTIVLMWGQTALEADACREAQKVPAGRVTRL